MMRLKYCVFLLPATIALFSSCERAALSEDEIPEGMPRFEILVGEGNEFAGFIMVRRMENPGTQIMINARGEIVWLQQSDTALMREFMPYEKSYLSLYKEKEFHEITYSGDTILRQVYGTGGFIRPLHHEIILTSRGDVAALTKEVIPYDLSRFGGNAKDTIKTDGIIVLTRSGEMMWHWTLDQVLDTLSDVGVGADRIKNDWFHANALSEDVDGNFLLSLRNINEIWKINARTGNILWQYRGETVGDYPGRFVGQHGIHVNRDGDYMIFNNGPEEGGRNSSAIVFGWVSGELHNKLKIDMPDSVFTEKQGSVYQFAEDKFLFCISPSQLIITDGTGQILWHAKSDAGFYRAYYVDPTVLD